MTKKRDPNSAYNEGVDIKGKADESWHKKAKQDSAIIDLDHELRIILLSEVSPQPINWIWSGRLAGGKITLLGGYPDIGKSQISTDIIARITTGAEWPDNSGHARLGS